MTFIHSDKTISMDKESCNPCTKVLLYEHIDNFHEIQTKQTSAFTDRLCGHMVIWPIECNDSKRRVLRVAIKQIKLKDLIYLPRAILRHDEFFCF